MIKNGIFPVFARDKSQGYEVHIDYMTILKTIKQPKNYSDL